MAETQIMHRFLAIMIAIDPIDPEEQEPVTISPAQVLPHAVKFTPNVKETAGHPRTPGG
jgi:hypothetical protein